MIYIHSTELYLIFPIYLFVFSNNSSLHVSRGQRTVGRGYFSLSTLLVSRMEHKFRHCSNMLNHKSHVQGLPPLLLFTLTGLTNLPRQPWFASGFLSPKWLALQIWTPSLIFPILRNNPSISWVSVPPSFTHTSSAYVFLLADNFFSISFPWFILDFAIQTR